MFKAQRRQKRLKAKQEALELTKKTVVSAQLLQSALASREAGVGNAKPHEITVSLTSFHKRIDNVHLTIESIFQQSLRPDRIILWLARDMDEDNLPEILTQQQRRGLEIRFMERDLGPYGKFFHTLKQHPDSLIITIDDDILYPHDMVDMLYRNWVKEPEVIHCHRAHTIGFDGNGKLLPYKQWNKGKASTTPSLLTFPTGVGGVLYFPGCFDERILDEELFMSICPKADDIWLKAMSLKKGVLCKRVEDYRNWGTRFLVVEDSQVTALKRSNKSGPQSNDVKFKAVWDYFDLWDKIGVDAPESRRTS